MAEKLLPALDERLAAIAALTPICALAADIGADHGHLSCHLLRTVQCDRMIVSDQSPTALARARARLTLHGLSERAVFRQADGLDALDGPVDAVVIAGMGSQTMASILERGRVRLQGAVLVLQPNLDPERLRAWLSGAGYRIEGERIVRAAGRMYVILRAAPGWETLDERSLYLGPCLMRERTEIWRTYLRWRLGLLRRQARGARQEGPEALDLCQRRIQWIEEALQ